MKPIDFSNKSKQFVELILHRTTNRQLGWQLATQKGDVIAATIPGSQLELRLRQIDYDEGCGYELKLHKEKESTNIHIDKTDAHNIWYTVAGWKGDDLFEEGLAALRKA